MMTHFFIKKRKIRFPVNNRELPGQLILWAVKIFRLHFPRWWVCYLRPKRLFKAEGWMDKAPGGAWVGP